MRPDEWYFVLMGRQSIEASLCLRAALVQGSNFTVVISVIDPQPMLHKHNAARRHRICKLKFKVTDWPDNEAGLRRRGSVTLSITSEALSSWQAPSVVTMIVGIAVRQAGAIDHSALQSYVRLRKVWSPEARS